MELNKNKPFTFVSVSLDSLMNTQEVEMTTSEILAANERYLVLNDQSFTKLELKKHKDFNLYPVPDVVIVLEEKTKTMIEIFGKFRIRVFSQSNIKQIEKKINTEFKNWINNKLARYGSAAKINIKLEKAEK